MIIGTHEMMKLLAYLDYFKELLDSISYRLLTTLLRKSPTSLISLINIFCRRIGIIVKYYKKLSMMNLIRPTLTQEGMDISKDVIRTINVKSLWYPM